MKYVEKMRKQFLRPLHYTLTLEAKARTFEAEDKNMSSRPAFELSDIYSFIKYLFKINIYLFRSILSVCFSTESLS